MGTYLYHFDSNDDLFLFRAPLQNYKNETLYDASLERKLIKIPKTTIRDFQVFGTQVIQSDVNSYNSGMSSGVIKPEEYLNYFLIHLIPC